MAVEGRRTSNHDRPAVQRAVGEGRTLAAAMPRLILEARRVAATVLHGLHGRRRAGSGENFWQYRRFVSGEPASRVDWRRSARDDHLYVREQEWEAAHTVWIWPDRSPSMVFASPLVRDTKLYRALVDRAGARRSSGRRRRACGHSRPDAPDRQPQCRSSAWRRRSCTIAASAPACRRIFPPRRLPRSCCSRICGAISATCAARSHNLPAAARAVTSCRSSIPPRRLFPIGAASNLSSPRAAAASPRAARKSGGPITRRACRRHRAEIRSETDRLAWSFIIHRTDRPASELLLALHARIGAASPTVACARARRPRRGFRHDWRIAARLCRTAGAHWAADPAGAVVAAAADPAAPAPHRLPADAPSARDRAERGNSRARAVVADRSYGWRSPRSSSSPPPVRCGTRRWRQ